MKKLELLKVPKKSISGMMNIYHFIKNRYYDMSAFCAFKCELKHQHNNEKLVVVFMCQYIPAWDKLKPTYDRMCKDPRYEVILFCVPSQIEEGVYTGQEKTNDTYNYYLDNGYLNIVNAMNEDGTWKNLSNYNPEYVFYCRPYNHFMPRQYNTKLVCRYSKICVILYAYILTEQIAETVFHKDFFAYTYCYFSESEYTKKIVTKQNLLCHKLGLQKTIFYGVPVIESIYNQKNRKSDSQWDSANLFKVIWAPRWTTDPRLGGSSFILLHEKMLTYFAKKNDFDLLIRPHPMMLDNFVRTGEMSLQDVNAFKQKCDELDNVNLDYKKNYIPSFWNSNVLISDLSSVIPEYLAMGKPVIYYDLGIDNTLTPTAKEMLEVCYVVHDCAELIDVIEMLYERNDQLLDKRLALLQKLFKVSDSQNLSKKIVEELINDN